MVGPIATERLPHTDENRGPTMFHMATVRHKRWHPCLLYRTSLTAGWILVETWVLLMVEHSVLATGWPGPQTVLTRGWNPDPNRGLYFLNIIVLSQYTSITLPFQIVFSGGWSSMSLYIEKGLMKWLRNRMVGPVLPGFLIGGEKWQCLITSLIYNSVCHPTVIQLNYFSLLMTFLRLLQKEEESENTSRRTWHFLNHRLTLVKGIYSFWYFLHPMRIPNLCQVYLSSEYKWHKVGL